MARAYPAAMELSKQADTSAQMAELVDAPSSGGGGGNPVEVRVLFWAPNFKLLAGVLRQDFSVPLLVPLSRLRAELARLISYKLY